MGAVSRLVTGQLARPHGRAAHLVGRLLLRGNGEINRWVIDALELSPSDHVLELGCGPGHGLQLAARRAPDGRVVGVDYSPAMVAAASKRAADGRHGNVEIREVDVDDGLPFSAAAFDAVFGVHVIYFWSDGASVAREVRRVLRDGGRAVFAFDPHHHSPRFITDSFQADGHTLYREDDAQDLLVRAGMRHVEVLETPFREYLVTGTR